jgi:hypothetical protein
MEIHGVELKPGMVLTDDKGNSVVVIPHKSSGIAFVSYDHCHSWSADLNMVLYGKLREIRNFPRGGSLTDGELLWKETKYRINDGVELDEEEFRKEIAAYTGKEVRVRVI